MSMSSELEQLLEQKETSYAGIPTAIFVEDVDAFMALEENARDAEKVIQALDEKHNKYKFMETNLMAKRKRLKEQIPDLEKSLDMIEMLRKQQCKCPQEQSIETDFLLTDQVYMRAVVEPTNTVCLWLGANVMLEYSLDDATRLLTKNVSSAKMNLEHVEHDLEFLRDQFTTTEVNMARVYNWDVKRRKLEKSAAPK